jgi:branched-subunit amino acid ABC-type transport system permease component
MDQHLIFLLLGLANGAVFASLAMALVVTYRSSGVLNFATGTIALYGAYTYAFLRQGQLLVLIPGLPEKVDLGSDLSFWGHVADAAHHGTARSPIPPVCSGRCAAPAVASIIDRSWSS